MTDSNDSRKRYGRRSVLKAFGATTGSLAVVSLGSGRGRAIEPSSHRSWSEVAANNSGDFASAYAPQISDYSDDPDEDDLYIPFGAGQEVRDFLNTIDQGWNHYKNPSLGSGAAPQNTANKVDEAVYKMNNGYHLSEVAEATGWALHYVQDIANVLHTGRELEQHNDNSIHFDYEAYIDDNWTSGIVWQDVVDRHGYNLYNDISHIQDDVYEFAQTSHDRLGTAWPYIRDKNYNSTVYDVTKENLEDAAYIVNGIVRFIWD